jgi:hypothetical protein
MSRGLDRTDERPAGDAGPGGSRAGRAGGQDVRVTQGDRPRGHRSRDPRQPLPTGHLPSGVDREPVVHHRREYRLRGTESQVLDVLATFRVVLDRDLVQDVYAGHRGRWDADLRSLTHQGLVSSRTIASDRQGHHVTALTLTPLGKDLLAHRGGDSRFSSDGSRMVHAGWGKRSELVHDASLYRMYLHAAQTITEQGGTIRRVVLDAEWKQRLYREANRDGMRSADAPQERLADLARHEQLPIVEGHVQLPDVRIEYDTATGERTRVDLELVTAAYHAGHIGAKQQAGFTLFSAAGHAGRGIASLQSAGSGSAYDPRYLSGLLSL